MSIPGSAASFATRTAGRQFSNATRQTHFSGGFTSSAYRTASKQADRKAAKEAIGFTSGVIRFFGGLIREGFRRSGKSEAQATVLTARETSKARFRAKKAIDEVSGIHND